MLYNFILTLLIIDGILLATVVLLQAGQGGGLASLGGGTTDLVMGGRQAVTILHTGAWWTGGIFLFLSLVLSVLATNRSAGVSDVQQKLQSQPTAPAPIGEAPILNQPPVGAKPPAGTKPPAAIPAPAPAPLPPASTK